MAAGRFITLEGGEGCGKSTQARRLAEALRARGRIVHVTREPGGTPLAERVRALLKEESDDPPCDRAELLLFLAARAQLVRTTIRPALARGEWVVSDRFSDSTFAYQGFGRGLPLDVLRDANAFACDGLVPDRTFLLEVPADVSLRRLRAREEATGTSSDRMEKAGGDFHARLAEGFRVLAEREPGRIVRIDATGTPDEVGERIWNLLKPFV